MQYTWVWGIFALVVVFCGCVSLFARTRKSDGLDGSSLPENAALFGKTTLLMALVAVAGFYVLCLAGFRPLAYFGLLTGSTLLVALVSLRQP